MEPLAVSRVRELCVRYEAGEHAKAIASAMGITRDTVRKYLRLNGVRLRARHEYRRTVFFDQSKFATIADEASAYWLGFLAADGSVAGEFRISVKLQRRDRGHLEKFREWLSLNAPVKDCPPGPIGQPLSEVIVYSKVMAENLIRHGVTRRKSHTLQPPSIAEHLHRHWIRGLFDGDGSIKIGPTGRRQYMHHSVRITSTEGVARWIERHFATHLGLRDNRVLDWHGPTTVSLTFSGRRQSAAICRHLYADSAVSLDRKREKAQLIYSGFLI